MPTTSVAAEPNTPATGTPTISGTTQVGETLTVDTSGITDADGLDNVVFAYQWLSDGTDIQGATGSSYVLADSDVGSIISARVSFTDNGGNAETLTSTSTEPVTAVSVNPPSRPTGLAVLATSNSATLTWDDPGDDSITGYQVLRLNRAIHSLGDFQIHVDDTRSNETTYTDTDTDVEAEARYVYRIKARNSAGLSPRSRFANADLPEAPPEVINSPATGTPTISGTAQVGETLTVDTSGITDADSLDNVSYSYQWQSDGTDIQGATGSSYVLADSDVGANISVRVSFTDDGGNAETLSSAATASVEAKPNTSATGTPTISGTVRVGETLTVDTSGITDADGLDNAVFNYQWLSDGTDITGATGSTYTLASADQGKIIKVKVSFTDNQGNAESLTSDPTATVASKPNTAARGAPTISGTAQVGQTLTADTSGISDDDGLGNASYSYQWMRNEGSTDTDISGATDSTYTLTDADQGKAIKVKVSFTDDEGHTEELTSGATDTTAPAADEESPVWSASMTTASLWVGQGYGSILGMQAGSLTTTSFEIDDVEYTVNLIEADGWIYIGFDREMPVEFTLEVDGKRLESGDATFTSYGYSEVYWWQDAQMTWSEGDTVELKLYRSG